MNIILYLLGRSEEFTNAMNGTHLIALFQIQQVGAYEKIAPNLQIRLGEEEKSDLLPYLWIGYRGALYIRLCVLEGDLTRAQWLYFSMKGGKRIVSNSC